MVTLRMKSLTSTSLRLWWMPSIKVERAPENDCLDDSSWALQYRARVSGPSLYSYARLLPGKNYWRLWFSTRPSFEDLMIYTQWMTRGTLKMTMKSD